VTIRRSRLPFFPKWVGATVPWKRTVLFRHGVPVTPSFLAHELAHVHQAERHPWPLAYLAQWVRTGFRYHRMPFEIEARAAERDPDYLAWSRVILERRPDLRDPSAKRANRVG
jgi:hypothetical protein